MSLPRPAVSRPRHPVDVVAAVALLLVVQVDVWAPGQAVWGDDPVRGARPVAAVLLALPALAVAWRRTRPLPAVVVGAGAVALQAMLSQDPPIGLLVAGPVLLLVYAVGAYASRARAVAGLAVVLASAGVHGWLDVRAGASADDTSWWVLVVVLGWLTGCYLGARRRSREAADRARRREEDLVRAEREAVTAERLRIAGELHDVVAHHLSVVALQAGAALEQLDTDREQARESLGTIEATARLALTEMGGVVGVLRAGDDPAQGRLAELPGLAERVRAAGLPVRLDVPDPLPVLPAAIDLAAFRIVQEALTNALRHATGATQVTVTLDARPGGLRLQVRDDGRAEPCDGVPLTGGHGLAGMRERAAAYGGRLEAAPGADGGYVVEARLPLPEVARA